MLWSLYVYTTVSITNNRRSWSLLIRTAVMVTGSHVMFPGSPVPPMLRSYSTTPGRQRVACRAVAFGETLSV